MGYLSKLALTQVQKPTYADPVVQRRNRVLAGIEKQRNVLTAKLDGKEFEVPVKRWRTTITGEREQFDSVKRIKPWFFEVNGEWFVQCKAGSRVVMLDETHNAVKCKNLSGVAQLLDGLAGAVKAGELDLAIQAASQRQSRKDRAEFKSGIRDKKADATK